MNEDFFKALRQSNAGSVPGEPQIRIDDLADAIIRGEYGNGAERQKTLSGLGFNYHQIQDFVNKKLAGTLRPEDYTHDFITYTPDTSDSAWHYKNSGETNQIPTEWGGVHTLPNPKALSSARPEAKQNPQTKGVLSPSEVVEIHDSLKQPYTTDNGARYIPNSFLASLLSLFPKR